MFAWWPASLNIGLMLNWFCFMLAEFSFPNLSELSIDDISLFGSCSQELKPNDLHLVL